MQTVENASLRSRANFSINLDRPVQYGVSGFTLIELLVVISIIGILAAMLLSTLGRAKAQANSAYCENNLKQIGLATQMYVDDNVGYYPYCTDPNGLRWEQSLRPYYPATWSNQVIQCPGYNGRLADWPGGNPGGIGSYSYNTWGATEGSVVNDPSLDYYLGLGMACEALVSDISEAGFLPPSKAASINRPRKQVQIAAPSELYAFMDATGMLEA